MNTLIIKKKKKGYAQTWYSKCNACVLLETYLFFFSVLFVCFLFLFLFCFVLFFCWVFFFFFFFFFCLRGLSKSQVKVVYTEEKIQIYTELHSCYYMGYRSIVGSFTCTVFHVEKLAKSSVVLIL